MTRKVWFWFLLGWAASLLVSPTHLTSMFKSKSAG